ncbi:HpcH/HpaI aldolase family protein [Halegenticoccus tardaugens]|uniref:HpcH/HpaI aldolase family protein n=1 Tax=Halegenticoccus tardaugens TaxID=2071624 RepID=UPI00100BAD67|nr:aldolase/citrate lyase family protein [Halegenticoccus tardaugens]
MVHQRLKHANNANTPLIGSWAAIPSPATAELLAGLGYDFVALDAEHTPMSYETMENMLRAVDAAPYETETIVRVPDDDPTTLKRTLDLDPTGILVPMVETADQAAAIVEATQYPPGGRRGLGITRASEYGLSINNHIKSVEETLVRHVQLESVPAIENATEIAAVDGIDGVFVGPVDLSMSMDCFGEWEDEAFLDAVTHAVEAAHNAGIAIGTLATTADQRAARIEWGVDYLAASVDLTHLADGAAEALDHCLALSDRENKIESTDR